MPITGNNQPISLYFHIPFCTKKCPYCHFYTCPDTPSFHEQLFLALIKELQHNKEKIQHRDVLSIYFGGGTPFLWESVYFEKLLAYINTQFKISSKCEITIEANPDIVFSSSKKIKQLNQSGINRFSIGVQSFDDPTLHKIGRTHNAKQALQSIEAVSLAGIKNISIDLMLDLPDQNLDNLQLTLSYLSALPITHISLYNLVIEPYTLFDRRKEKILPSLPKQALSIALFKKTFKKLKELGFTRYEISAFAKDNLYSVHNTGYWTGREFLGCGPSAFSYFNETRYKNCHSLSNYLKKIEKKDGAIDFSEKLPIEQRLTERLLVYLRLTQGIEKRVFDTQFAKLSAKTIKTLAFLEEKKLLTQSKQYIRLTAKGFWVYDSIAQMLV